MKGFVAGVVTGVVLVALGELVQVREELIASYGEDGMHERLAQVRGDRRRSLILIREMQYRLARRHYREAQRSDGDEAPVRDAVQEFVEMLRNAQERRAAASPFEA